MLERFADRAPIGTVLVPLAGKSRDLTWLVGRGDRVIGVELVESAVVAYFEEQSIPVERFPEKSGVRFEGGGVTFWAGDFFKIGKKALGSVDWIFDRAALVALPEEMREKYVAHNASFLGPGGVILLVTLEHDPKMGGPPFSILPSEVERLYAGAFTIEELGRTPIPADNPRFAQAGIAEITEVAYRLVKVA
jgi:thiopurine S-methyltransferase